jgi:hypothetical protein
MIPPGSGGFIYSKCPHAHTPRFFSPHKSSAKNFSLGRISPKFLTCRTVPKIFFCRNWWESCSGGRSANRRNRGGRKSWHHRINVQLLVIYLPFMNSRIYEKRKWSLLLNACIIVTPLRGWHKHCLT